MEEQDPRTDQSDPEPPPVRPGDYPPGTYADLTPYTYLENRRCVEPECWAPLPDIGDRPGLFSPRCIPHREARLKEKQKGDRHKRPHPKAKPVNERKPRETKQTVAARCQRWKDALCAAVADEGIAVAEGLRRLDVSMGAYERQRSRDPVFRANIDRAKLVGKGHDTDTRRGDLPFGEFAQLYFHRTHFTHQLRMIDEIERLDAQDVVMILASPESGKTSTLEDYINKTLAQDPTHRFRIVSESQDLAIRIVGACARRFRETEIYPAFIARYGPFYEKGQERAYAKPWTSNQLTLWKNPGTERDRNLVAQSWNGANYGSRIDTLIIDDVISQRNVGQSQEIFERIRGTFFNRGVEMRTIIIGTRIKPGDFYDKMDDAGLVTRHIYIPATGGLGAGPGEPTTPEMWQYRLKHSGTACCPPGIDRTCPKNGEWLSPKEYLDLIRFKAGEETWWASYMQNPRDDAVSTFGANLDDCKDKERTIGPLPDGLGVLSIDPALGGGTALVAAVLSADRLRVVDSHNVRGLAKTEQQIELIEQYARRYRPAILIVEYDAQQKGLGNDDRLRALGRQLGFQIVPHITRGQKFDVPYAVASMNQSFIRREISIPWGDPETVDKMEQLVYQLRGWRIPEEGKKDRQVQDLVMALWFIWRYWMGHRDGGGERYAPAKRPSWVPRDPRRHLHAPVSR